MGTSSITVSYTHLSFALDLLGKAKNLDDAISLLFTRIGRAYHLDRISLLEIDPEFLSSRFTYQWARKKADMKMGQTIYISREMYESCLLYTSYLLLCSFLFPKKFI